MTPTGPAELLATWEAGLAQHDAERSLLLHRAARPGVGIDALLSMPVGEREADLFALRRALFGERLQVRVACASCDAEMEFDLDATSLGVRPRALEQPLRVAEGAWVVEFRLPTVADLAAAGAVTDREEARHLLLARCTVAAARDGIAVPPDQLPRLLPEDVRRALAERAERADPTAEVTLRVSCPECGAATRAELDISSYLWTELDAWARDVLLDVHLLATAYGWSEPEILALSPLRRRYYLELCADA